MVYPLLAAMYPVVALYAVNLREMVPVGQLIPPVLVALTIAAVAMLALRLVGGDAHRAGMLTTLIVVLFFSYGPAWEAVGNTIVGGHATGIGLWIVAGAVAGVLVWRMPRRHLAAATPALNLVALVLVAGNLVAITRFQLEVRADGHAGPATPATTSSGTPEELPDIYWIILDRYGSQQVLERYYGHDIAPFLDELRERGFYVADEATANYLKTAPSLVSARNLEYLDGAALRERASADDDWGPLYRDLSRSFHLLDVVREHGYRFVYLGTYWDFTASHPEADVNYVYDGATSEFATVLRGQTVLRALDALGGDATDPRRERWHQTRFQWDRLGDAIGLGGPKLVHAHFSLPHDPYVFHADGSFVPEETERARTTEANYADQVEYANAAVLDFVDELLAADPERPPIVVVQAEEGPWPDRFRADETGFRWAAEATDEELHEKYGILSAFHLPGLPDERAEEAGLYPSITLVNEWRVILNRYLGTDYPLLPDRNFVWPSQDDIYTFIDVTDRVRRMVAP